MRRAHASLLTGLLPMVLTAALTTAPAAGAAPAPRPTVAVTAPTAVRAGDVLTMSGRATPARAGRTVALWEQRGQGWETVAETTQSATGRFALRARVDAVGRHSYRAVTSVSAAQYGAVSKGPVRVVTTLPARPGAATLTYLGRTDPVGGVVDDFGEYYTPGRVGSSPAGPSTVGGDVALAGRVYPRSLRTTSRALSWVAGTDAATFSATLGLVSARRGSTTFTGTRVIEVDVDGITRVRRTMEAGEVLPVVVRLAGARYVSVRARTQGWLAQPVAADLVVGTPTLSSAARAERGVVQGQLLTNLDGEVVGPPADGSDVPADAPDPPGQPLTGGFVLPGTVGRSSLSGPRFRHGLYGGSLVALTTPEGFEPGVQASIDYPIEGRWTHLTARPAYWSEGRPRPDLSARIELYGDGRLLAALPVVATELPALQRVDVTGVQRLSVRFVSDHPLGDDLLALADPRLS